MSKASEELRQKSSVSDTLRDKNRTVPSNIVRYLDIPYGKDCKWQSLDVYRPIDSSNQKLPVIISVHGGGWVYGDKEVYKWYCMDLALRGFAVVNYSYRLAPEHKFPSSLEDTISVFKWVIAHCKEYGFDPNNLFAVGDSAGAHLLTIYTAACTNADYSKLIGIDFAGCPIPKAAALNCGVYNPFEGNHNSAVLLADLLPKGGTPKERDIVTPIKYITEFFPPTFIMTCTGDFLLEQAPMMAHALLQQDVPFVYRLYGDRKNRLPHVFHCNLSSVDGRKCNDDECDFFYSFAEETGGQKC